MLLFHPFSPLFVWYHSNCFEVFPKRASRPGLEALGAGDGIRTRDPLLGKQLRYHCATPAWQSEVYSTPARASSHRWRPLRAGRREVLPGSPLRPASRILAAIGTLDHLDQQQMRRSDLVVAA